MTIIKFKNIYLKETNFSKLRPKLALYFAILISITTIVAVIALCMSFKIGLLALLIFFIPVLICVLLLIRPATKEYEQIEGLRVKKSKNTFLKLIGLKRIDFRGYKMVKLNHLLKEYLNLRKDNRNQIIDELINYFENQYSKRLLPFSLALIVSLSSGMTFLALNFYFTNIMKKKYFWVEFISALALMIIVYYLIVMIEIGIGAIFNRRNDKNKAIIEYLREIKMEYLTKQK